MVGAMSTFNAIASTFNPAAMPGDATMSASKPSGPDQQDTLRIIIIPKHASGRGASPACGSRGVVIGHSSKPEYGAPSGDCAAAGSGPDVGPQVGHNIGFIAPISTRSARALMR